MGDEQRSGDGERQQQPGSGRLLRAVWFRQTLHRWQSSSAAAAATASSASASDAECTCARINQQGNNNNNVIIADTTAPGDDDDDDSRRKRLPRVVVVEERRRPEPGPADHPGSPSPSSSPMTPDPPPDVPRGCCAVYVGAERRRFVVPTAYLGMPVFARLLEKAEEEFGFDYSGAGITIPCDTEAFKYILLVMEAHRRGLVDDEGNPKDREKVETSSSETR